MLAHPKYKNSAAFYDVDGTLIKINIVHAFAYYAARHASLARSARDTLTTALSLPVFWAADKLSRKWFNEIFYRSYEGASEDRLVVLADELLRMLETLPRDLRGLRDGGAGDRLILGDHANLDRRVIRGSRLNRGQEAYSKRGARNGRSRNAFEKRQNPLPRNMARRSSAVFGARMQGSLRRPTPASFAA